MEKKFFKKGHQSPKGWRVNRFNYVEIREDFHYCASHNFLYNSEIEKEKLYNAQPCYYTDNRFLDSRHNYSGKTYLYWSRSTRNEISLKSCIRKALQCRNIPVGTVVEFQKDWYYPGKKVSPSYKFKIIKENKFDVKYEINLPGYFRNFTSCEFSKNLVDALRANGFIVDVRTKNPNFLSSMIATASAYTGQEHDVDEEEGEIAIAYGYGKKIGISSGKSTLFGYSYACDSILWDHFGEFDKWSRCNEILKTTPIDEIVKKLKNEKPIEY